MVWSLWSLLAPGMIVLQVYESFIASYQSSSVQCQTWSYWKKKILLVDLLSVVLFAFNILIVVSNLAYKTLAECIKIQITAENKKLYEKSVRKDYMVKGINE